MHLCVYSKRVEVKMIEKALSVLEYEVKDEDTGAEEMKQDIIAMETGLAECAVLAEAVTGRRKEINERLAGLLHKLEREESLSRRIMDEVSLTTDQVENMARTMVMQKVNISNPVMDDQRKVSPTASPRRQVFTNPLPSIRQLPTLLGMVAATLQQQGGIPPAAQNKGGREGRLEGEVVRSCKSVRGGFSGIRLALPYSQLNIAF